MPINLDKLHIMRDGLTLALAQAEHNITTEVSNAYFTRTSREIPEGHRSSFFETSVERLNAAIARRDKIAAEAQELDATLAHAKAAATPRKRCFDAKKVPV